MPVECRHATFSKYLICYATWPELEEIYVFFNIFYIEVFKGSQEEIEAKTFSFSYIIFAAGTLKDVDS